MLSSRNIYLFERSPDPVLLCKYLLLEKVRAKETFYYYLQLS